MVVKLSNINIRFPSLFESSVILYGSQAIRHRSPWYVLFESSVILYGSQAKRVRVEDVLVFESSVILYGSQAYEQQLKEYA